MTEKTNNNIDVENGTITHSEESVQPTSATKSSIDNALIATLQFLSKPWRNVLPVLTLCNKITVAFLITFFISGYLPAVEVFTGTQSLYELLDGSLFLFMILSVTAFYALGVKRIISKLGSLALVIVVLYNGYEVYSELSKFSIGNSSLINESTLELIYDSTRYGLYLWFLSFIGIIVCSILPAYQNNDALWPTLNEIINTPVEGSVNVQQYTSNINAGFQSVVNKGHASLQQAELAAKSKELTKLQGLNTPTKIKIIAGAIIVILIIPMIFSGNSAPSASEIEAAFTAEYESTISNVKIESCEELSERKKPTFECYVSGKETFTLGALGALLGDNSKKTQSFNGVFVFVESEDGWYFDLIQ